MPNSPVGPFPFLHQDGSSTDWRDASYNPRVKVGIGVAHIEHGLSEAEALKRLIETGFAAWAVELRCPKTLMAQIEESSDDRQEIRWQPEEVDGDVYIIPGILATKEVSLDDAALDPIWTGTSPIAPRGWWLARGSILRASSLAESLLTFKREDGLQPGRMEVKPAQGSGNLRFDVRMAPDIFENVAADRTMQVAALVGACSWFPRFFTPGDGDEEYGLAREIRSFLASESIDIPLWDDTEGYDPVLLATCLEPFLPVSDSEK